MPRVLFWTLALLLFSPGPLSAEEGYTFVVDDQPKTPQVLDLDGERDNPGPGDVVMIGRLPLVLDDPETTATLESLSLSGIGLRDAPKSWQTGMTVNFGLR